MIETGMPRLYAEYRHHLQLYTITVLLLNKAINIKVKLHVCAVHFVTDKIFNMRRQTKYTITKVYSFHLVWKGGGGNEVFVSDQYNEWPSRFHVTALRNE
jgi:hypothetical protein